MSSVQSREGEARDFCQCHGFFYVPWESLQEPSEELVYVLNFGQKKTEIISWVLKGPGSVFVDFVSGGSAHRRRFGGGRGELIAKAVGLKNNIKNLHVLDATAGLGGDAIVLANLGCKITLYERNPVVFSLLQDGLVRARQDSDAGLNTVLSRITLNFGEADFRLATDVVYLDPMFPERGKSSLVKKEMQVFKDIVGEDADDEQLLSRAMASDARRIVVKRPRLAASLGSAEPTHQIVGKSSRFDVYSRKSLTA